MATAGYNEKEVTAAIEKLWKMRKEKKFMDAITLRYLGSLLYSKSISRLSTLLNASRGKSKAPGHPSRPRVSDIEWA